MKIYNEPTIYCMHIFYVLVFVEELLYLKKNLSYLGIAMQCSWSSVFLEKASKMYSLPFQNFFYCTPAMMSANTATDIGMGS